MGRPRGFDTEEVLDRILDLFWRRGFAATSIDDLTRATGLRRGSLYQAFGGKAEMFAAALDRYLEAGPAEHLRAMPVDQPLRRTVDHLLHAVITDTVAEGERKGCFLTNTAVELGPHDPATADRVERYLEGFADLLAEHVEAAMRRGELRPGRDPRALADSLLCTIQGIGVMARVTPDRGTLDDAAKMVVAGLD